MTGLKVYKASAGSGKTYTLALEYIKELLLSPAGHPHRKILAVTFTKDATGEMKDRILAELYGLAFMCEDSLVFLGSLQEELKKAGKPMSSTQIQTKASAVLQEILHDYSHLHITTIDSFFQKVLRNLARELGKSSRFNLEMNSSKVLADAVSAMIENAHENPQLLDWLTTYIEEKLEEGDNWRIQREILRFSFCIFNEYFQEHEYILKRQLDSNPKIFGEIWNQHHQIQKSGKDFFKKAYAEITSAMNSTGLSLSDFSRSGTAVKYMKKLADGDLSADMHSTTVQDCLADPAKWSSAKNLRSAEITGLASAVFQPLLKQCVQTQIDCNTSGMIMNNLYQLGLIWDITGEISRQNEENNRFMLADTALFLHQMIDDSDTPFIYEKIGAEIKHVMIDEFQDTSRIQWRNFKSLLSGILATNDFSMIVGDVKQSIYRWRNGDWSILNHIEKEIPVQMKTLSFNYRSEQEIISFNNRFFTSSASVLDRKFRDLFGETKESPFLLAYNSEDVIQESHKKGINGYVSVDLIPSRTDAGKYPDLVLERISEQIRELYRSGIPARDICILTRTNKSIIQIASYLSGLKEKYPELHRMNYLDIISNEAFQLSSSPAIRIIIEALRVLSEPENPIYQTQLRFYIDRHVKKVPVNLNDPERNIFIPEIMEESGRLLCMPLFELIGHLYRIFDLDKIEGQSNYMFSFYDAVAHYLKDYPADIPAFLKYWEEDLHIQSVPSGAEAEGIRAMTIHKSKGLQFHTVLLPYCDWELYPEDTVVWCGSKTGLYDLELLPVKYSSRMYESVFLPEYEKETGQAWMDNLNILYVAFTRAERNLLITGKQKKKLGKPEDVRTVADLLQYTLPELEGSFNPETMHFEKGILEKGEDKEVRISPNILKKNPEAREIFFISKSFDPSKSIFKQSNQSEAFINSGETPDLQNEYILQGNIMHALFSGIRIREDIGAAVDRLVFEGTIRQEDRDRYVNEISNAISVSNVDDWFSDKYRIYNECDILIEENGVVTSKRPDRVLLGDLETIIIDYKFGESHPAHRKQMQQYIRVMEKMGYPGIRAYLWYVKKNLVYSVSNTEK